MIWVFYSIIGLSVAWLGFAGYVYWCNKKLEGADASPLKAHFPELNQSEKPYLVYCHAPSCGPCRSLTPRVEQLKQHSSRVILWDISEDYALAKRLGIHGTPSFLQIKNGRINRCLLGAQKNSQLHELLEEPS